jgi:phytoene dehydrogenase-like protein
VAASGDTDVVVVGGGLAGLAVALYLSRAGLGVTLHEKTRHLGGRARTRTIERFRFNLGPHALYCAGQGAAVLHDLGVRVDGNRPRHGAYAVRSGRFHTLPIGFVSLASTGLLRPLEKLEAARRLNGLRTIDTSELQNVSLSAWLQHSGTDVVRELLEAIVRVSTYTDAPEAISAGAALEQVRRALQGVRYLHGGWQTIVDQLRAASGRAGVEILVGSEVATVIADRRVQGIQLVDGTVQRAPFVVLACSPQEARALTEAAGQSGVLAAAAAADPVQISCLDVALDRLPRPTALIALGIDRPLYASVHSAVARLAPDGGALIHVARYGSIDIESPVAVKEELQGLLDGLQPGWRHRVVYERFLPNMTVSHAMVTAAQGGVRGRPGPGVADIPGLFVVGDWVGPEGMLGDAALSSARQAAGAILTSRAARRDRELERPS